MRLGTRGWRPGSRMARLHSAHSYRPVLGMIAVTFVFAASAPSDSWARATLLLLEAGTLVLAMWTSGLGHDSRPWIVVGAVAVAVAVLEVLRSGNTIDGGAWILDVVLVVTTIAVIGLGILDQGEVNQQSITGAICVYVLLGLLFTFLYGALAALGSGPFFAQGTDGTTSIRLYFSYTTLATLGYGDYTAAGSLGRTLAITEALLGQLYLVTVVALLVGNIGRSHTRSGRGDHPDRGA